MGERLKEADTKFNLKEYLKANDLEESDLEGYADKIENLQVLKYLYFTRQKINEYKNIMVSVSGGSDSDILVDMFAKFDKDKKVHYVFFDTGLEYTATKRHLNYLENRYGITIERIKAKMPIPLAVKKYGVPFLSKDITDKLYSMQINNFNFEKDSLLSNDELKNKYNKNKSVIDWWTNSKDSYNIKNSLYLKEYIVNNIPKFKFSSACCRKAKKEPSHEYEKTHEIDLKVTGVRRVEGGVRATSYKNCFTSNNNKLDEYRPLFFFTDKDKEYYKNYFNIKYSDCYEVWGFKRTGCVGCPFNSNFNKDLEIIKQYEPKLHKACMNIFGKSYEYTQKYREFKEMMKKKEKE